MNLFTRNLFFKVDIFYDNIYNCLNIILDICSTTFKNVNNTADNI